MKKISDWVLYQLASLAIWAGSDSFRWKMKNVGWGGWSVKNATWTPDVGSQV